MYIIKGKRFCILELRKFFLKTKSYFQIYVCNHFKYLSSGKVEDVPGDKFKLIKQASYLYIKVVLIIYFCGKEFSCYKFKKNKKASHFAYWQNEFLLMFFFSSKFKKNSKHLFSILWVLWKTPWDTQYKDKMSSGRKMCHIIYHKRSTYSKYNMFIIAVGMLSNF